MPDAALSLTISRDELNLPVLELNAAPFTVTKEGITPGEITLRREEVKSPYVHGSYVVNQVKDQGQGRVVIQVDAPTYSDLKTHIQTLIDAFSQWDFVITFTFEGAVFQWNCTMADYAVGFVNERWHSKAIEVGFQFPRHPVPLQGAV
jgi:hypothetical protein